MGFVASSGLFFMANDEHSIARSFSYIAIKAVFFNGYLRYGCTYSITGVGITDLLLLETSSILPRSQPFRCSLDCSGWWLDFRIGPPSPIYRPRCERLQPVIALSINVARKDLLVHVTHRPVPLKNILVDN